MSVSKVFLAIPVSLNMKLNMILNMNLTVAFSWTSRLVLLLQYCLSCPAKALLNSVFIKGSALVV